MAAPAAAALRKDVLRGAKQQGLSLRPDALRCAVDFVGAQAEEGWDRADTLAYLLEKADSAGAAVLDEAAVQKAAVAVREERAGAGAGDRVFESVNVFKVQRHMYDAMSSQFVANLGERKMDTKTALLRDRFQVLLQRLLRDPKFEMATSARGSAVPSAMQTIALTPIGALLGSEGFHYVFGMLSKNERMEVGEDGVHSPVYWLEDLDGRVALELSEDTKSTAGLITEGCCVFAEGEYVDGVFRVAVLAHPPPEPRAATLDFLGNVNLFGGSDPRAIDVQDEDMEAELSRLFVTLSDVHLDQPAVMEKLRVLLTGYAMMEPPPAAFVLMGNFFTRPSGNSGGLDRQAASRCFADLAALINEFPALVEESEFVLVPGPTDPGPAPGLIPRPPLPSCFTEELRELLPNVHLGSNPCRIHFCGQHMVFFREDLMHKMRRSQVISAEVDNETVCHHHHLAATVLAQASLCPLLPMARPVHWGADHGLQLYPQPHLIVLADRAARYAVPRDVGSQQEVRPPPHRTPAPVRHVTARVLGNRPPSTTLAPSRLTSASVRRFGLLVLLARKVGKGPMH